MRAFPATPRLAEWPRVALRPYTSEYERCVKFSIAPQHVVVQNVYPHNISTGCEP